MVDRVLREWVRRRRHSRLPAGLQLHMWRRRVLRVSRVWVRSVRRLRIRPSTLGWVLRWPQLWWPLLLRPLLLLRPMLRLLRQPTWRWLRWLSSVRRCAGPHASAMVGRVEGLLWHVASRTRGEGTGATGARRVIHFDL